MKEYKDLFESSFEIPFGVFWDSELNCYIGSLGAESDKVQIRFAGFCQAMKLLKDEGLIQESGQ